ncbi:MAG: tRNA (N6-threonylcarbamoyladenosine(37)-N6)-methyltransferase TrmO [Armatimonadota bacterium]|jgi:tRNA-Thr(GGU) m(6)t(6)A37 methyltransferase TsaA
MMLPITVAPVAFVIDPPEDDGGEPLRRHIDVLARHEACLLRIEECEHLWILYWMSELEPDDREVTQVHPRGDRTNPLTGVFATHSQMRPNPIGMTRVRLLGRDGLRLTVEDLDAFDGSPVLDIKSG